MGDDNTFDRECESMPTHSEQVAAESTALHREDEEESHPFRTIDQGTTGRIIWELLLDETDKEAYLHVKNIPDHFTQKEIYFAGFGFSEQLTTLPFSLIVQKIVDHTALPNAKTSPISADK